MKDNIGIEITLDWKRIRHLLKLGLIAGIMVLVGDMLLGWGVTQENVPGFDGYLSRYLTVSDSRIFFSALLGLIGIPIECMSYFAIYRLIASRSSKLAHIYRAGLFGMMIFGAGVHVLCCASVYIYRKLYVIAPNTATEETLKFALYFLLPATILFLIFYVIFIVIQIIAFVKGKTPYPKWAWIFTPLFGVLCILIMELIGDYPLTNALTTGWISLGGIWMCGGLLVFSRKLQK